MVGRIVASFDEFFDAFDKETEDQLKMLWNYSVRNRFEVESHQAKYRTAVQVDVKNLFSPTNKYEQFQAKIREYIFLPPNGLWRIGLITGAVVWWASWTIVSLVVFRENFWAYAGFTVWPWTHLHALWTMFQNIFWGLIFFSAFQLVLSYYLAIRRLNMSRHDLIVWQHIEQLEDTNYFQTTTPSQQPPAQNSAGQENYPFTSYSYFYKIIAKIGSRAAWITFGVILFVLIQVVRAAFTLEWLVYGTITWIPIVLSIIIIPGSLIIFLLPQNELHKLLSETKYSLLQRWQIIYNERVLTFLQRVQQPAGNSEVEILAASEEIETLQDIITETSLEKEWTVGIPATVGVSTVSIIPTVITVYQNFFPFWF
jgi:hypothetical protein